MKYYFIIFIFKWITSGNTFQPIELKTEESFVIELNDNEYDDELIKVGELKNLSVNLEGDNKYEPLHSFVKHFNRKNQKKITTTPTIHPETGRLFVADFQNEFKKYYESEMKRKRNSNVKVKQQTEMNDYEELTTILVEVNHKKGLESDDYQVEAYDYDKFKAEYYDEVQNSLEKNLTLNYTNKGASEETPKDALKKLIKYEKPRNCTREQLSKFGINAFECLSFDLQHRKRFSTLEFLQRVWIVIRIWLCIYMLIAIPCWCQKGWCCCCFCCKFCNPHKTIRKVKKFYSKNPPGFYLEKGEKTPITYEPTSEEKIAYKILEHRLKQII